MRHLAIFALMLCLGNAFALAQEADPIREQLNKAVRDHEAIVANAKAILTYEFDASVKATAATGNLDAVQKLVAEKKAYQTTGTIPAWLAAVPAFKGYPLALMQANARLEAAYKSAEIAYTKALKIEEAEAVRAARIEAKLSPPAPDAAIPGPVATATPKPGGPDRLFPMGAIDLMPFIDLEKDSVQGRWSRTQNGLESDRGWGSALRIRYEPPEEYDFLVEFTRNEGSDAIGQLCWGYGHRFRWFLGSRGNTLAGFDEIGPRRFGENPTSVKVQIENGRRYKSIVKVRKNQISCYLDERLLTTLQTDYSDLSYNGVRGIDDGLLGIATWSSAFTIHKLALAEITGRGKKPIFIPSSNALDKGKKPTFPKTGL